MKWDSWSVLSYGDCQAESTAVWLPRGEELRNHLIRDILTHLQLAWQGGRLSPLRRRGCLLAGTASGLDRGRHG